MLDELRQRLRLLIPRVDGGAGQVAAGEAADDGLLLDDAAPGNVVGEPRLHVGQELPAHGGVHAVRADDEIARVAAAVGEDGRGAIDALEHHRVAIAGRWKRRAQRLVDARPGARH